MFSFINSLVEIKVILNTLKMNNATFSDFEVVPLENSNYVKPVRIKYTLNGRPKVWDLVQTYDAVVVIIFNITRNVLVLVRQFRPAVYYNSIPPEDRKSHIDTAKYPLSLGITNEFCAGCVDKSKSIVEIACEEVHEECGYKVSPEQMQLVKTFRSGVGVDATINHLFYVEVTDTKKVSEGGGLVSEGEVIEVVEFDLKQAKKLLNEPCGVVGFLYGLEWFFLTEPWKKKL